MMLPGQSLTKISESVYLLFCLLHLFSLLLTRMGCFGLLQMQRDNKGHNLQFSHENKHKIFMTVQNNTLTVKCSLSFRTHTRPL